MRFSCAISIRRALFVTPIGVTAPPFTVASLAVMTHSVPLMTPTPPTSPAPGFSPFMPCPASAPISTKYESRSSSISMRCRGKRRPRSRCRWTYFSPPPAFALARAARTLSSALVFFSRFSV